MFTLMEALSLTEAPGHFLEIITIMKCTQLQNMPVIVLTYIIVLITNNYAYHILQSEHQLQITWTFKLYFLVFAKFQSKQMV